jgi:hypothetical protein
MSNSEFATRRRIEYDDPGQTWPLTFHNATSRESTWKVMALAMEGYTEVISYSSRRRMVPIHNTVSYSSTEKARNLQSWLSIWRIPKWNNKIRQNIRIIGKAFLLIFGRLVNASVRRFLWRAVPKYFHFLYLKGSLSRQYTICSSSKSSGNIPVYLTSLVATPMSPGQEIHFIISHDNHTTPSVPLSLHH